MLAQNTSVTEPPRRLLVVGQSAVPRDESLHALISKLPNLCCEWVAQGSLALEKLAERDAAMLLLVANSASSQIALLFQRLREHPVPLPTAATVPEDADPSFIQLAASAVDEVLFMPLRLQDLKYRIMRLLGGQTGSYHRTNHTNEAAVAGLVGRNAAFLKTVALIPVVARGEITVLITGETGTGKELCARAVHALGPRKELPFVPIDCASVPEHLFENEFFGHSRGAFTDAHHEQKGLVAIADGGTLFLDEVDALSLGTQAKLLRFLQDRMYRPLGSDKFFRANVKIVVATNKDLETLVQNKQFRADLLFRINVIRLHLPPLRARREDIGLLAENFVKNFCLENNLLPKTLAPASIRALAEYEWPGNARELCNVIQRAILITDSPQILPWHLENIPATSSGHLNLSFGQARAQVIESFERRYVADLMRECQGNVSRAALLAKKERRTFGRLVKRYHTKDEL